MLSTFETALDLARSGHFSDGCGARTWISGLSANRSCAGLLAGTHSATCASVTHGRASNPASLKVLVNHPSGRVIHSRNWVASFTCFDCALMKFSGIGGPCPIKAVYLPWPAPFFPGGSVTPKLENWKTSGKTVDIQPPSR